MALGPTGSSSAVQVYLPVERTQDDKTNRKAPVMPSSCCIFFLIGTQKCIPSIELQRAISSASSYGSKKPIHFLYGKYSVTHSRSVNYMHIGGVSILNSILNILKPRWAWGNAPTGRFFSQSWQLYLLFFRPFDLDPDNRTL